MHINFPEIFPALKTKPVKIRVKRTMRLTNSAGENIHVNPGDEVEVSRNQLAQLDRADIEVLAPEKDRKAPVVDPTPKRPEPAPMPENWKGLPACFKDFWDIEQDFITARQHIAAIKACRVRIFGVDTSVFGGEDYGVVLVNRHIDNPDHQNQNIHFDTREIDTTDPDNIEIENYIRRAEDAAADYLDRLKKTKSVPMQRAYYDCGLHRIGVCEELQNAIAQLHETGLSIFGIRVAPLGLAQGHILRLYHGSADFVKYSNHAPAASGSVCSAGYDDDGILRRYSDDPVPTSASLSLNEAARLKALKELLKTGKQQLADALKRAA